MNNHPASCSVPAWLAPVVRVLEPVARFLTWLWRWLRDIGVVVKPCRFSLLMVSAGLVFLFVDQGLDTLRDFAERTAVLDSGWTQAPAFALGAFLWAFGSWYWARVLYRVRLDRLPKGRWVRGLQKWLPRFIGLAAILGLTVAFFRAAAAYPESARGAGLVLALYGYASLAGAVLFFGFVLTRRDLASRFAVRLQRHRLSARLGQALAQVPAERKEAYARRSACEAMREGWVLLGFTLVVAVVLFVVFAIDPEGMAPRFGSAPILLLAAAGWIAVGSTVDLFGMSKRFPVFVTLLIVAVLASFVNDNHAVRILADQKPDPWEQRPTVTRALLDWKDRQLRRPLPDRNDRYPLFVVAAEGGGIRAAYWTARVLTEIQYHHPCFADQLVALSGVSGGSLGATVFLSLVADARYGTPNFRCGGEGIDLREPAQRILGEDFLAPAIAATLYPDLFQRIWPWPVRHFDRARALEAAWENAWERHARNPRFAGPFDQLWHSQKDYWMPALLLNSTWVETGKRLITSNLKLTADDFNDVEDLHRFYGQRALALSTAVHLSARFTYVSPAGTLEKNGEIHGRAVDGGYFENSGMTGAFEILKTVGQLKADCGEDPERKCFWNKVEPVAILISNDPVDSRYLNIDLDNTRKNKGTRPSACCNEVWSPFRTLFSTREARGTYARETTRWHLGSPNFVHFGLCKNGGAKIPLGWVLSDMVQKEMDHQLGTAVCPAFDNPDNLNRIDRWLKVRER